MASELLNVQQPLASPDASLLHNTTQHRAHLHSDKFFNLCTKSSASQHQVIYTRSGQSDGGSSYFGGLWRSLGWPVPCVASRQPAVPTALQRPSAPPHSYGVTPAVVFTCSHPPKQVDLFLLPYLYFLFICPTSYLSKSGSICIIYLCIMSSYIMFNC